MSEEERNEIPDGMDEMPLHPQTVEGKIREMRDIGVELIESTDSTRAQAEKFQTWVAEVRADDARMLFQSDEVVSGLLEIVGKLSTLVQLQTDTITQLYGELRGPGW